MKKIQTVLGQIESHKLGITLTHEHFSLDFDKCYCEPPEQIKSYLSNKIELENLGFIRQYPYGSRYNLKFDDDETHIAVEQEVIDYKKFGGGSIVENTSHGLNRNLPLLYSIAKKTGVNIIAGTGHYIFGMQNEETLKMSLEEMTDLYSKEILSGCESTAGIDIKCGFIGEVGSGWPINEFEKKAIKATGEVQEALGCAVSFHPGRNSNAPFEIMRLYLEAGGSAKKCVMSHLERTIFDDDQLLEFTSFGTFCQFDLFGTENSYYQLNPLSDMPSDAQRIDRLLKLCNEGKDRILISHDIHTKHRLVKYGGHGFSHIINNIIPRFKDKGFTDEQIDKITIENPIEWLEFNV